MSPGRRHAHFPSARPSCWEADVSAETHPASETTVRVRYAETDQMGRAYYGAYFTWFEVARVELLRQAGFTYADLEKRGVLLPVIEAQCKYLAPAVYDQLLRIVTRAVCTGRSRVEFTSEVFAEGNGRTLATSRVVLACVGPEGKPRALPEPLREWLVEFDPSFGQARGRAASGRPADGDAR